MEHASILPLLLDRIDKLGTVSMLEKNGSFMKAILTFSGHSGVSARKRVEPVVGNGILFNRISSENIQPDREFIYP